MRSSLSLTYSNQIRQNKGSETFSQGYSHYREKPKTVRLKL
ncbi:Uncharacterised protein [Vibrio cholerae]|nr:Uncharacterised protein [Vibrio cholerae]